MAKCPISKRVRKPLNLTVSEETYEYLKNGGFNVSRFVDAAIKAMKNGMSPGIILVSSKEGKSECCHGVSSDKI